MAGETATIYRDELRPVGVDTVTIKATDGAGQTIQRTVTIDAAIDNEVINATATAENNAITLDWEWK